MATQGGSWFRRLRRRGHERRTGTGLQRGQSEDNQFPLRLIIFIGFFISLLSIAVAVATVILGAIYYRSLAPAGIPMIITSLFFSRVKFAVSRSIGWVCSSDLCIGTKAPLVIDEKRINFVAEEEDPVAEH